MASKKDMAKCDEQTGVSKEVSGEWLARAKCTVLKEFTVRGSQEVGQALTGQIVNEVEIDQLSVREVLLCREL